MADRLTHCLAGCQLGVVRCFENQREEQLANEKKEVATLYLHKYLIGQPLASCGCRRHTCKSPQLIELSDCISSLHQQAIVRADPSNKPFVRLSQYSCLFAEHYLLHSETILHACCSHRLRIRPKRARWLPYTEQNNACRHLQITRHRPGSDV